MATPRKARKAAPRKKAPVRAEAKAPPRKKATPTKARRARERPVPAVSPLRGMPVDQWIASKTSGWQTDVTRRILAVIQRAAPKATCSIKWGQPVFEQVGPFAFIKPAKGHLSVGFWRGSEIVDPKGILERGDRMGHFKLRGPGELDERALAIMVADAVRLNEERGNPARRT
jgi:hypothetical protein